ncbi:hypothetical protein RND81_02G177400 [Saponaria officinalis]|uniref:Uncharacterized protein n=1 Tax=Saponaria officinalis TaxID=3572 RepID=A0AAW1MWA1_SAPOF
MKDMIERKLNTTESTLEILSKTPPKKTDPGKFAIPCALGTLKIDNAFCDLGASVSILPYSVYKKLPKTPLIPTSVTVQQADRTIIHPLGKIEDIPVQVGKLFIPADLIVLDIPEDAHVPIILGRPFLFTAGALIDVGRGAFDLHSWGGGGSVPKV